MNLESTKAFEQDGYYDTRDLIQMAQDTKFPWCFESGDGGRHCIVIGNLRINDGYSGSRCGDYLEVLAAPGGWVAREGKGFVPFGEFVLLFDTTAGWASPEAETAVRPRLIEIAKIVQYWAAAVENVRAFEAKIKAEAKAAADRRKIASGIKAALNR